ncbi:MAG TPA: metabolite traffic protein EboE [Tepidisphaeraceae bacterium]|jgi:sugar phosphate isomerase/epimerase|nr:metabolite traffic protein EboE [Tepidisphaeraceae bacterium]
MAISELPLSYCTNVHPGRSIAEVNAGLDRYTVDIRNRFGHPLAAGLWLASPVVSELAASDEKLRAFAAGVQARRLPCYTLNAFPYGDFHSERVKDRVYLPDWSQPARAAYTRQCAQVLAQLMPAEITDGSISTVPLAFKGHPHDAGFTDQCIAALLDLSQFLTDLEQRTQKTIRLAIEPEPSCVLETTAEALAFFERLFAAARARGAEAIARRHLGVCFDVCHQAVEFEDVTASIATIDAAGVRINKVHVSCALQIDRPATNATAREALRRYVEPRYQHQTTARTSTGAVVQELDLTGDLLDNPPAEFAHAAEWRIHFHVPISDAQIGPLRTTRDALPAAFDAVAKLDYAPHLELETYTWEIMPGEGPPNLAAGLTRELIAARQMIEQARR